MEYSLDLGKQVLLQTPQVLISLLSELSENWIDLSEGPDSWSPRQVVGHLTFVEENDWIDRTMVILQHGASKVFDPIDREGGFERFSGWSLSDLLDRFASVRHSNLVSLDAMVDTFDLRLEGRHPDLGRVTLGQLLATWVVHDLNHLGQIVKTMAKQYSGAVGPWRRFLPIIDAP
jgi:DinB superfamily